MYCMHRVIIVGGGFAGVSVARQLAKRSSRKAVEIVLIDERSEHVYTPWLYEVATAFSPVRAERVVRRVRTRASIPFAQFPGYGDIRITQKRVAHIDKHTAQITYEDGTTIRGDVLVLAVGSLANDFDIPGVRSYTHMLKTPKDAEQISVRFERLLNDIAHHRIDAANIVVVGAGANGVELAGEIAMVRRRCAQLWDFDESRVRVTLCDSHNEPVYMFPRSVRTRVARRLTKLGITFEANAVVREITPGEVHTAKKSIPFDIALWSAGVKSQKEPGEIWGLAVNARGRVRVDATFRVLGSEKIFALGDAAVRESDSGNDPQSAQAASAQAHYVAKNILAFLAGKTLVPFVPRTWQTLLAVGGAYGVGSIFGIPVWGRFAFYLRRLVDLKYFLSVFPLVSAGILWYRGVNVYGKNHSSRS